MPTSDFWGFWSVVAGLYQSAGRGRAGKPLNLRH